MNWYIMIQNNRIMLFLKINETYTKFIRISSRHDRDLRGKKYGSLVFTTNKTNKKR